MFFLIIIICRLSHFIEERNERMNLRTKRTKSISDSSGNDAPPVVSVLRKSGDRLSRVELRLTRDKTRDVLRVALFGMASLASAVSSRVQSEDSRRFDWVASEDVAKISQLTRVDKAG